MQVPHEVDGKEYRNHLFVSEATGTAKLKLNGWEAELNRDGGKASGLCMLGSQSIQSLMGTLHSV